MAEISVFEGDNSKADFTLTYGPAWSVVAKRGTPVLQSEVSRVYFYVKTNLSDTSAWLTLTDASSSQIAWLNGPSATDGKIRVYFGTGTLAHAGDAQRYELRLKLTDGTYCTVEAGTFNVSNSVVDNP